MLSAKFVYFTSNFPQFSYTQAKHVFVFGKCVCLSDRKYLCVSLFVTIKLYFLQLIIFIELRKDVCVFKSKDVCVFKSKDVCVFKSKDVCVFKSKTCFNQMSLLMFIVMIDVIFYKTLLQ